MLKNCIIVVSFVLLSFSTSLGQDLFLKVGSLTQNGSPNSDFRDYILIEAAQFAASGVGTGGATEGQFAELILSKHADKLSASLYEALVTGVELPKTEILLAMSADRISQKIELNGARVRGIASVASAGECTMCGFAETVNLDYRQIRITTYVYDDRGKLIAPSVFMYDTVQKRSRFD